MECSLRVGRAFFAQGLKEVNMEPGADNFVCLSVFKIGPLRKIF